MHMFEGIGPNIHGIGWADKDEDYYYTKPTCSNHAFHASPVSHASLSYLSASVCTCPTPPVVSSGWPLLPCFINVTVEDKTTV